MSFLEFFRKTKSNQQYHKQTIKSTLLELLFFIVFLIVVSISMKKFFSMETKRIFLELNLYFQQQSL